MIEREKGNGYSSYPDYLTSVIEPQL